MININCFGAHLPKHSGKPHDLVSLVGPTHFLPFPMGGGLVHERDRELTASPQVLVHGVQSVQKEKPPSTVRMIRDNISVCHAK